MGIWKIRGGMWWNGESLEPNEITAHEVTGEGDREFRLAEEDIICGGLVDMHCHLWAKGIHKSMGVSAQMIASSGVVRCLDGGSFGYLEWPHADRFWRATNPIENLSYLNIREEGLRHWPCEKPTLPDEIDVNRLVEVANSGKGRIFGIKAHLGWGKDVQTDMGWMRVAREVADRAKLPVGVHITNSFMTIEQILSYLKPGDVVIHVYQGKGCAPVNPDGSYSDALIAAQKRGIIMDGAVGMNHLSWKVFKAAQEKGFTADVVTTDAVGASWQDKPFRDLPHVMSAFMNAGMPVQTVLRAVTTAPAEYMGFKYDSDASLLVLKRQEGEVKYYDSLGENIVGNFEYITSLFAHKDRAVISKL